MALPFIIGGAAVAAAVYLSTIDDDDDYDDNQEEKKEEVIEKEKKDKKEKIYKEIEAYKNTKKDDIRRKYNIDIEFTSENKVKEDYKKNTIKEKIKHLKQEKNEIKNALKELEGRIND